MPAKKKKLMYICFCLIILKLVLRETLDRFIPGNNCSYLDFLQKFRYTKLTKNKNNFYSKTA